MPHAPASAPIRLPPMSRRGFLAASSVSVLTPLVSGCAHTQATQGPEFNVRAFGAVGDGQRKDTLAIQAGIDACAAHGGGTVTIPPGVFVTGPLALRSHLTLHVEAGATLLGSLDLEDYKKEARPWSGESEREGLLTAVDASQVAIVGRGTIDGRGMHFMVNDLSYAGKDHDKMATRQRGAWMTAPPGGFPHGPFKRGDRPGNLIRFGNCRGVWVGGVTIQNSPTWTMQIHGSEDVRITGVNINSIDSDRRVPNDDGMDIHECRDVRVDGCTIDTGDDCIAIFGSEDITVTNCVLHSRSAGVRVGYDGKDIRSCTFSNLVIRRSNRGVSVFVRGGGSVEDIAFSNIIIETQFFTGRWWGKAEPIHISTLPWDPKVTTWGRIRNVSFSHIKAVGEAGIVLRGCPESVLENITLDDVHLHVRKGPLQESYGGNFDLRSSADPKLAIFEHDIPALYAGGIAGLRLRDVRVDWDDGLPDFYSSGLEIERFKDVVIDGFVGRQAHVGRPGAAIVLRDGVGATVRGSQAAAGTDLFVQASNLARPPALEGNDTSAARLSGPK